MIKLIVSGASGKMGSRIIALSRDITDIKLAGAIERKGHTHVGQDIGTVIGLGTTGVIITDDV
ncbi:MAG TPA: hypothetical protein DDX85_14440 [Nitrospiraceae bacterium]|nr:hypothetical protein [Nitrospiraceae bacterium]